MSRRAFDPDEPDKRNLQQEIGPCLQTDLARSKEQPCQLRNQFGQVVATSGTREIAATAATPIHILWRGIVYLG